MSRSALWRIGSLWVLVGAAACGGEASSGGRSASPPSPRDVTLTPVRSTTAPRIVAVTGVLQAQDELALAFQVPGRIAALAVDVGAPVAAGDVVARLDQRDFALEAQKAMAAWTQARARLGLLGEAEPGQPTPAVAVDELAGVREASALLADATRQRARLQELVDGRLRSAADLEAADAAWKVAESRLQRARDEARAWIAEAEVARTEVLVARQRLQDCDLRAPWAGRVLQRSAAAGQYVAQGAPVLTLLRLSTLRLRLQVPERAAAEVRPGQTVRFTVDSVPGSDGAVGEHEGTVARLSPAIERQARTLLVEAEVPNADGRLLPGGFCRARIVVEAQAPVLTVERSAVLSFAGVERAFVVEDGKAVERLLRLGRELAGGVEVLQGLAAGEQVVMAPKGLVAGAPVRVQGD